MTEGALASRLSPPTTQQKLQEHTAQKQHAPFLRRSWATLVPRLAPQQDLRARRYLLVKLMTTNLKAKKTAGLCGPNGRQEHQMLKVPAEDQRMLDGDRWGVSLPSSVIVPTGFSQAAAPLKHSRGSMAQEWLCEAARKATGSSCQAAQTPAKIISRCCDISRVDFEVSAFFGNAQHDMHPMFNHDLS